MTHWEKLTLYAVTAGTWLLSQLGIGAAQSATPPENNADEIYLKPNIKTNSTKNISSQIDELLSGEFADIQSYGHRSHQSHRSHRSHYSGTGGGYYGSGSSAGRASGGASAAPAKKNDIIPIAEIQKQLNLLGYDCGTADGQKGAATVTAIKNFQIEYGLEASGYVDWQTEAWLNATKIEYVRNALKEKGYTLDQSEGRTQSVVAAIKDFQKKHGLDENGRIDLKTKQALNC